MTAEKPKQSNDIEASGGYRTLVPGGAAKKPAAPGPKGPTANIPTPAVPGKPESKGETPKLGGEKPHDDPTRFGDWEIKGRCIDF